MGNCLVTKLKASVSDSFLPILGYQSIKINVDTPKTVMGNNDSLCIYYENGGKPILISGNGYFTNGNGDNLGQTLSHSLGNNSGYGIHFGGEMMLYIPEYSSMVGRFFLGIDGVSWELNTSLYKYLFNNGVERTGVGPTTVKGKIEDLLGSFKIYIYIDGKNLSPDVYGSLDDVVLNSPTAPNIIGFKGLTNITGSVESILNQLAVAATSTYKTRIEIVNSPKVTYNGTSIGAVLGKNFSINSDHTWNPL